MSKTQRRWSSYEDAVLREEVHAQLASGDGKAHDWNRVAERLPSRTNKDCRKRYLNGIVENLKKGPWTEDEDRQLEEIVRKHGQAWAVVASQMTTRSADREEVDCLVDRGKLTLRSECAKRWAHSLDPALDRSQWTEQEVRLLISAVQSHGTAWKDIQQLHFPSRAANNIKNQHTLIKRKLTEWPDDVPSCCTKSARGSGDEMDNTGSLWGLQDFSSSCDFHGGTIANFFDSVGDSSPRSSPLYGSGQSYLDPDLLSKPLQPPSATYGVGCSFDVFSDQPKAVSSVSNSLEDMQFEDLLRGSDDLGNIESMDLDFSTGTVVPSAADIQGYSNFMKTSSSDAPGQAQRSLQAKIEIDGVEASTVSSIMDILVRSNATVRLETRDSQG